MTTYYLVQGDDAPQIKVTLTRDTTGEIIDLTDKTAIMKFRKKGTNTLLSTLPDVAGAANNAQGIAIFQWDSDDLDISHGIYEAEVEVTDNETGRVETVYERIEFSVREDF